MSEPVVIAVDCDLRRVHAWCSKCGQIGTGKPDVGFVYGHAKMSHEHACTVLFEIASPMSMAGNRVGGAAMATNVMKWAIFNSAEAMRLHLASHYLLVSPSSRWTLGYDVKTRHKIANATAKNKDLRECQAMIHFHAKNPKQWVSLPDYLANL